MCSLVPYTLSRDLPCMSVCCHKGWYHHDPLIRRQNELPRSHVTCEYKKKCNHYKAAQKPKHCWKWQIGHQSTCLRRCSHFWEYSTVAPDTVIFDILSCVWFTRVCYKIKSSVLNILSLHVVFAIYILMLYVTVVFEFAWVGCEIKSSDLNT